MIWDDTGFLLSKNRYNENSLITEIFTKEEPDLRILLVSISASSTFSIYSRVWVKVTASQEACSRFISSALLHKNFTFES